MRKISIVLLLLTFLLPSSALANTKTPAPDPNQSNSQIPASPTLTLYKEVYDGKWLSMYYTYDKTRPPLIDGLEVPKSIQQKVPKNDPDSIKKVTAQLALYYNRVGNISKLNQLFGEFEPFYPQSKIVISQSYRTTIANNFGYARSALKSNPTVTISKSELSLVNEGFGDQNAIKKFVSYSTTDSLYKVVDKTVNEYGVKWYQKSITYIVVGIVVVFAFLISFILYKRR